MARTNNLQGDRFRLIWALLLWEGTVSNARLRQLLDIETVMVSRLLSAFLQKFPGSAVWDRSRRCYDPTGRAPEGLEAPSVDEYLAWVRGASDAVPWLEEGITLQPTPDPRIFAAIQRSCATGRALRVTYVSMSNPDGRERVIAPHALARIGDRWLVRSWCTRREHFLDMMLDRFVEATMMKKVVSNLPRDDLWLDKIELRLRVHGQLPVDYAKLIQRYRFGGAVAARRAVRKALVPYVLQNLRAAVDPKKELPPAYELEVINPDVVRGFLFPELRPDGKRMAIESP